MEMVLIISPYTAGNQNSDYRFHQFVNGLINSTTSAAGNVVQLVGQDAYLYDHKKTSSLLGNMLFLRPVFTPLTEVIDQGLASGAPVMISGTPGVGKTMMRNFYLRHLLLRPFAAAEEVRTIIIQGSDTSTYNMVKMERIPPSTASSPTPPASPVQIRVTASKGEMFSENRFDVAPVGDVFTLVDVTHQGKCSMVEAPTELADKLVVFASPSNTTSSKFFKTGMLTYYMPLWTLTELLEANTALGLAFTEAAIRERYDKVGGMARFALFRNQLSFDQYCSKILPQYAASLGLTPTSDLITATTFTGSNDFLHSLAYFVVGKLGEGVGGCDFSKVSLCWGTKYIATEIVAKWWHDQLTERMRNTTVLFLGTRNPAMVGHIYEGWALRKLQISGLDGMKWQFRRANPQRSRFKTLFGDGHTCKQLSRYNAVIFFFIFVVLSLISFHLTTVRGEFAIAYADPDVMAARARTAPARTLIVPSAFQYPVISCVMKSLSPVDNTVMLYVTIQITVAHEHTINPAGEAFLTTLMNAVFPHSTDTLRPRHVRDQSAVFYLVPPLQYRSFALPASSTYGGAVGKVTLD